MLLNINTIKVKVGRPLTARQRARKICSLSRLARRMWVKACQFDDIPVGSAFVVFSKENPYARRVDRSRGLLSAYLNQEAFPHASVENGRAA